jgi:hypothetical protein
VFSGRLIDSYLYSAVNGFWPVEEFAKLVDGPTGCGKVTRVGVYLLGTSG